MEDGGGERGRKGRREGRGRSTNMYREEGARCGREGAIVPPAFVLPPLPPRRVLLFSLSPSLHCWGHCGTGPTNREKDGNKDTDVQRKREKAEVVPMSANL